MGVISVLVAVGVGSARNGRGYSDFGEIHYHECLQAGTIVFDSEF